MTSWRMGYETLYIAVNSVYYIGTCLCKHLRDGDGVFVVGHKFTNDTSVAEIPTLIEACTKVTVGDWKVDMRLSGTADQYTHSSRSLLDIAVMYYAPSQLKLQLAYCAT